MGRDLGGVVMTIRPHPLGPELPQPLDHQRNLEEGEDGMQEETQGGVRGGDVLSNFSE